MNPTEFNKAIQIICQDGITEGVAKQQMAFETMIGILESHKQALFDWRAQAQAAAMMAKSPPLILPASQSDFKPK